MRASLVALLAVVAFACVPASAAPVTCDAITADHDADLKAEQAAFASALAAKKLTPAALQTTSIGAKPFGRSDDDDDSDKALRPDVKPWTTFKHQGRAAIAGDTYLAAYGDRDSTEFVADAQGNIWRVVRAGRMTPRKKVTVKACSWGCWGSPGGGMNPGNARARTVYFLPAGKSFKGDVRVDYTWQGLVVTYVDQGCAPPP